MGIPNKLGNNFILVERHMPINLARGKQRTGITGGLMPTNQVTECEMPVQQLRNESIS